MLRTVLLAAVCILPAACGNIQPFVPDTARLTTAQLGSGFDPDVTAINQAQWAFADAGRTYGRPIEAARAAASMDYIAGQFYTSPRWSNISALTKEQLLQGRQEVRAALGIPPSTPSQAVVNQLTAAGNALADGNQALALAQLSGPTFTTPPEQVLARLTNMPYLQKANVATMRAANELYNNNYDDLF
ncbi:MAG TPA: hypothetical protein VGC15_07520 [Acetobacteraceae bacterium]